MAFVVWLLQKNKLTALQIEITTSTERRFVIVIIKQLTVRQFFYLTGVLSTKLAMHVVEQFKDIFCT